MIHNSISINIGIPQVERGGAGHPRKSSELPLDWDADQLREHLFVTFPPLKETGHQLMLADGNKDLHEIPENIDTPKKLRDYKWVRSLRSLHPLGSLRLLRVWLTLAHMGVMR